MADITKPMKTEVRPTSEDEDFTLNAAQMQYMINAHNAAEAAYVTKDWAVIDEITASEEWQELFGAMSWDQAYDRYEVMMGFVRAAKLLSRAAYRWHLIIEPEAQADIDGLTRPDLFLLFDKLKDLLYADDPTDQQQVTDIKPLSAPLYRDRDLWRKRAGNWRILYRIEVGPVSHLNITYKGRLIIARVLNRRDL